MNARTPWFISLQSFLVDAIFFPSSYLQSFSIVLMNAVILYAFSSIRIQGTEFE